MTQRVKSPTLSLWCRLAGTTRIQPLAQEFPYVPGVAVKRKNKQTKKKTFAYIRFIILRYQESLESCYE